MTKNGNGKKAPCFVCDCAPQVDTACAKGERPAEFREMSPTEVGMVTGIGTTLAVKELGCNHLLCDAHMNAVAAALLAALADVPKEKARTVAKVYGLPESWIP